MLDNSVRRQVAAAGTRIEQLGRAAAEYDAQHGADAMNPALSGVRAALDRLGGRVAQAHSDGVSIVDALSGSPQTAELTQTAERPAGTSAVVAPNATAAPSSAEIERAERTLVGASLVSPEVRAAAAEWPRPEDFASADAAQTWRVVLDMTQRGDPVDFVLVASRSRPHARSRRLPTSSPLASTLRRCTGWQSGEVGSLATVPPR